MLELPSNRYALCARGLGELFLQSRSDPIPDHVRLLAFCGTHDRLDGLAVEFVRGYQRCGLRVSGLLGDRSSASESVLTCKDQVAI